jgi:hypothetical protein
MCWRPASPPGAAKRAARPITLQKATAPRRRGQTHDSGSASLASGTSRTDLLGRDEHHAKALPGRPRRPAPIPNASLCPDRPAPLASLAYPAVPDHRNPCPRWQRLELHRKREIHGPLPPGDDGEVGSAGLHGGQADRTGWRWSSTRGAQPRPTAARPPRARTTPPGADTQTWQYSGAGPIMSAPPGSPPSARG